VDKFFEVWDEVAVESSETDEQTKRVTVTGVRKFPVADKVKLGLSGRVAVSANIVAHQFEVIQEKIAFLKLM